MSRDLQAQAPRLLLAWYAFASASPWLLLATAFTQRSASAASRGEGLLTALATWLLPWVGLWTVVAAAVLLAWATLAFASPGLRAPEPSQRAFWGGWFVLLVVITFDVGGVVSSVLD